MTDFNKLQDRIIMEIKNSFYNTPSFGVKIKTESLFETTSKKIFHNTGIIGFKEVCFAFGKTKFPGHWGYAKQSEPLVKQILDKYPEIAKATAEIKELVKNNPNITKTELERKIRPIIEKFGDSVDIII